MYSYVLHPATGYVHGDLEMKHIIRNTNPITLPMSLYMNVLYPATDYVPTDLVMKADI
jgi:hypothetical protein